MDRKREREKVSERMDRKRERERGRVRREICKRQIVAWKNVAISHREQTTKKVKKVQFASESSSSSSSSNSSGRDL